MYSFSMRCLGVCFLMCRVELKGERWDLKRRLEAWFPNVPCGVERFYYDFRMVVG